MAKWWELEPLPADAPEELGDECEAFQSGRWAEFRSARGREVPSWAWLNQVAHVSETDLRVLVRARIWRRRKADEWTGLRARVAGALLRQAVETGIGVAVLQRAVLVPIELSLFGLVAQPARSVEDEELLLRILSALRHPSAQPGSW